MKRMAKISGIAYVMIFITGFYANFSVIESLIDINNPSFTASNMIKNHTQLGYGLFGFLVMLFFDVLLVWSLFHLTKTVSRKGSYLASFFRLAHALFFSVALFRLWKIYQLTLNDISSKDLSNMVSELLSDFDTLWTIGLLFFGVHLIVFGYLAIKSTYISKTLGLLLILAAIGYIVDGIAKLFMANYSAYKDVFETIVVMPSVIGEFSFTVWLLITGFNKEAFCDSNDLNSVTFS